MNTSKEFWKEYPLDFEFENDYKIEVSNYGQIKTFNNLHPEGKIIAGTLQNGFPIVRIKLFKKRTQAEIKKIETLTIDIKHINEEIKSLLNMPEKQEKIKDLKQEKEILMQKRKKLNYRIDLRRTINFALLKHKAVAELFLDKSGDSAKKFVIHKDFNKENNFVENLEWATQEMLNGRYMKHPKNVLYLYHFKKQFAPKTVVVRSSKLSEIDVLTIKKRLEKGDTLSKLAQRFNVSDMQIHRIKTGKNWGHIKTVSELKQEKNK